MKKIKIFGCDYEVVEVDQISREEFLFGNVDHVEQIIKVSNGLKIDRKAETLLHEVLHCIFLGLGEYELHANESLINALSSALVQVLKDNKELSALLAGL
jgi:hypothetical protein